MLSSPVKNCNDFFRNRPPLVIFLICLIALAIFCFAFAFYVQNTEQIVNVDAQRNWDKLVEFIDSRQLCYGKNYEVADTVQYIEEFTTFVTVNLSKYKNLTDVQVFYNLEDFHSNCPLDGDQQEQYNIKIDFFVPKTFNKSSPDTRICAKVRGPKKILPKFSKTPCQTTGFGISTTNLYSENSKNSQSCPRDVLKLAVDKKPSQENFAEFLNEEDRTIIYIHLMWCSYVLVFLIIVLLLYSIFHQHQVEQKIYH